MAPFVEIPTDLVDSLGCKSPHDALLALANESEQMAAKLAEELALSLSGRGGSGSSASDATCKSSKYHHGHPSPSKRKMSKSIMEGGDNSSSNSKDDASRRGGFPIPLPRSLRDAPRPVTPASSSSADNGDNDSTVENNNNNNNPTATTSRTLHKSNPSHPLTHATLATESILSSLSKIASGGSAASSEMRALEQQRQCLDAEALDLEHALQIREGCVRGGDSLMGRRYGDAARAVKDVNGILEGRAGGGRASERARELAGGDALAAHAKTVEVLKRAIGERYETAVQNGDVAGLSELTPLLGMLDMEELGVKLYLQYSQSCLCQAMSLEVDTSAPIDLSNVPQEEGMSRAAMRRRAEEQRRAEQNSTVPMKLAKIYNAAVTHLRHHLPMVAYALGEADGDAALVQLVHVEAEKRAVDILREHMAEKELGRTVRRAEMVASKMEDRYAGVSRGGEEDGLFGMDETNIANVIMGLGAGGDALGGVDIVTRRNAAQREDCGFTIEVGNLSDVDAALEEWALVMQHTESYERFIRHASREVIKARKLRKEQKREETRRLKEMEEANSHEGTEESTLLSTPTTPRKKVMDPDDETDQEDDIEILPPHTALNEVAAEIGGHYSSLERCLLLAGMQRAFVHANFPDDSTFTEVAIGNAHHYGASTRSALQTNLVEECLFAARRSTLRAFATGHAMTASAAANVCVDVLGRVLLEVLTRRAELGASLVKPGEGLLDGQSGLGQAAFSFARSTAGKGLRGVQGAAARAGAKVGDAGEETPEAVRRRTLLGVARAAANFNDLEVVADYTKRLEVNFLREVDAGYPPRGHDTEQLRMCVKGLGGVVESFVQASSRSMEGLISTILPRARQIVNDAVGQEGGGTGAHHAASNFLGGPVLTGGAAAVTSAVLDYNLDEASFELAQISEGYIGRM